MNPKKTFYVWKCCHCNHRNKELFNFHWKVPERYHAVWLCSKCGHKNYVEFYLRVFPMTEKRGEDYYNRYVY